MLPPQVNLWIFLKNNGQKSAFYPL